MCKRNRLAGVVFFALVAGIPSAGADVYFFGQPLALPAGAQLKLTCSWDNTTPRSVTWGEGTSDQMCLAYFYLVQNQSTNLAYDHRERPSASRRQTHAHGQHGEVRRQRSPFSRAPRQPTPRVYKRIDDHSFEFATKVDGKATTTMRVVVSRDGKTQTVTVTGKNAQGQAVNNALIFEKQ